MEARRTDARVAKMVAVRGEALRRVPLAPGVLHHMSSHGLARHA
jgi:hypothetical protein